METKARNRRDAGPTAAPRTVAAAPAATASPMARVLSEPVLRVIRVALLVLIPLLCYIPAMRGGYIWDDNHMVYANPLIQAADGLKDFWFTRKNFDYFPLTSTSLWIEWRLWGNNPMGYHVVNVLLHCLNALLFWRVLLRLKIPAAWLGAMIFAVHPVAVASVAWIAERKNTLAMIFNLLAVLWFLRWREGGRRAWAWYLLSLLAFAAALFSKTAVVVTPIALAIIDWWKRGRLEVKTFRAVAPFIAMSIVMGSMTILFQYSKAIGPGIVRPESMLSRVLGIGWCLWFYLYKALVPLNLMMVYPRWHIDPAAFSAWLPLALYIGMLGGLWMLGLRRAWGRVVFTAVAVHGVMVLPVLGLFKVYYMRFALAADHWQYFAFMAPVLLVTGSVATWARDKSAGVRQALAVAAGALVLVLAILTFRQSRYYIDEGSLWTHNIERNPAGWVAYNNLAVLQPPGSDAAVQLFSKALSLNPDYHEAYFGLGQTLRTRGDARGAIESLDKAVGLRPDFFFAQNVMGLTYLEMNEPVKAARHFRVAVATRDEFAEAWSNLGLALHMAGDRAGAEAAWQKAWARGFPQQSSFAMLGALLSNLGRLPEAEQAFRKSLDLVKDPAVLFNFGQTLEKMQRLQDAEAAYREAVALNPNAVDARHSLALLLTNGGKAVEACEHFTKILQLLPNSADARYGMGCAMLALNRGDDALAQFQEALRVDPNMVDAANGIGVVYTRAGRYEEALPWFNRALAANPAHLQSKVNRAEALSRLQRIPESLTAYQEVADECAKHGLLGDAVNVMKTLIGVATNAVPPVDIAAYSVKLSQYQGMLAAATSQGAVVVAPATNAPPVQP